MVCLSRNCRGIETYKIDESKFSEVDQVLNESATRPFKGTLKIHQVLWNIQNPNIIHARRLSCLNCTAHEDCSHYELGKIQIQFKVQNFPTKSGISDPYFGNLSPDSPQAGPSNHRNTSTEAHSIQSPGSPVTSEATTESITPGYFERLTPDNLIENSNLPNHRPVKRVRRFFS